MNTKKFFGYVKDKETNKSTIIRGAYRTKKEFICDLHANGYAVKYVCLDDEETIEKASQKYHERLEFNRNIQRAKREQAREQNTVESTHIEYKATLKQVILLDLIYLALHQLDVITTAKTWLGNEFYLIPDDLEKRNFVFVWRNFWYRCFIKDFLKVCKIKIGLLNHKLNKEIEQNECVTCYAEDLLYIKDLIKQDFQRLKEG